MSAETQELPDIAFSPEEWEEIVAALEADYQHSVANGEQTVDESVVFPNVAHVTG